jgi:hypothetical protein
MIKVGTLLRSIERLPCGWKGDGFLFDTFKNIEYFADYLLKYTIVFPCPKAIAPRHEKTFSVSLTSPHQNSQNCTKMLFF